jgi:hypothetical protein
MAGAGEAGERKMDGRPIAWPRYVRWLAVAYVLSQVAGPAGFFVLGGVAALLIARHGLRFDNGVPILLAAACACPAACAAFRWWFRRWGRRHWPPTDPAVSVEGANDDI